MLWLAILWQNRLIDNHCGLAVGYSGIPTQSENGRARAPPLVAYTLVLYSTARPFSYCGEISGLHKDCGGLCQEVERVRCSWGQETCLLYLYILKCTYMQCLLTMQKNFARNTWIIWCCSLLTIFACSIHMVCTFIVPVSIVVELCWLYLDCVDCIWNVWLYLDCTIAGFGTGGVILPILNLLCQRVAPNRITWIVFVLCRLCLICMIVQ